MTRKALYTLHTKANRAALETRKPPYYETLSSGLSLGYRKTGNGKATWTARKLGDDGISYSKITLAIADDGRDVETISARDVDALAKKSTDAGSLLRKLHSEILSFESASILARKWAAQNTLKLSNQADLRVSQAIENYADHRDAKGASKRNLQKEAAVFAKHVPTKLLNTRLADLDRETLQKWIKSLTGSDANKNRIISMLRAALNLALDDGKVQAKTWDALKTQTVNDRKETGIVLTNDQISDLINKAPDQATANLLEGAALSGFRVGELIALSIGDYNKQTHILFVPKNKTKARTVAISSAFAALIERLSGKRKADEPIFLSPSGSRWRDGEQYKCVKAAVAATELSSDVSIYDLRHSHITHSIQAGLDLMTLCAVVGTSPKMITENYFHVINSSTRRLLDAVAPAINREVAV